MSFAQCENLKGSRIQKFKKSKFIYKQPRNILKIKTLKDPGTRQNYYTSCKMSELYTEVQASLYYYLNVFKQCTKYLKQSISVNSQDLTRRQLKGMIFLKISNALGTSSVRTTLATRFLTMEVSQFVYQQCTKAPVHK